MKKIILFTVVLIGTSVSAQNSNDPEHRSFRSLSIKQAFEDPGSFSQHKPDEIGVHSYKQPSFEADMIRLLDSVYIWDWDTTNSTWLNHERIMDITYDENNRFLSQTWQEFAGSEWINSLRLTYSYDANSNILSQLYENWIGNWVNNQRSSYIYDNRNNQISRSIQSWNGNSWTNVLKWIYTYDDNDNLITELVLSGSDTTWHNLTLKTTSYNAFNYSASLLEQRWKNNNWENEELTTYSYDADTVLILQLHQNWNISDWVNANRYTYSYTGSIKWTGRLKETWQNAWTNSQLITKTYDAHDNWTGELVQVWEGSWENDFRSIVAYDNSDNRIEYIMHSWNGASWANYYKDNRTYDPNNFIITFISTEWAENGTDTLLRDSTHYYFHTLIGIRDHNTQKVNIRIYPNPGSGEFTIQCNNHLSSIEVYSLAGRKVLTVQVGGKEDRVQIETSSLSVGTYLIRFFSGKKLVAIEKVVKL